LKKTPSPTPTTVKDQPFPTPETFQSIPRQSQEHRDEEIEPIQYQSAGGRSNEGGDEHGNNMTIDTTINAMNEAQPQVNSESSSGTMEKQGSAWGQGTFSPPPTIDEVVLALQDIKKILKPPRKTGPGYKDPELDLMFWWLEDMRQFMWMYINPNSGT
jgi:hypothetical protein